MQGTKLFYLSGLLGGRSARFPSPRPLLPYARAASHPIGSSRCCPLSLARRPSLRAAFLATPRSYPKVEMRNMARFISVMKFQPLTWRSAHPYILADRWEVCPPPSRATARLPTPSSVPTVPCGPPRCLFFIAVEPTLVRVAAVHPVCLQDITPPAEIAERPKCDRRLSVYGYLRGTSLRPETVVSGGEVGGEGDEHPATARVLGIGNGCGCVHMRCLNLFVLLGGRVLCWRQMHMAGVGDFPIMELEVMPDPCPLPTKVHRLRSRA